MATTRGQAKKRSTATQAKPIARGGSKEVLYNRPTYKLSDKPYCPRGKRRFPPKTGPCRNKKTGSKK